MDHLLLPCEYACELWSFVFCLFRVQWVMPAWVIDMLACWKKCSSTKGLGAIWNAVPLCLMWMLWWERNRGAFEDSEHHSVELKMVFLRALYDWMASLFGHSFSSVFDFSDSCHTC